MACIHAKHILTGEPHCLCILEAKLPLDFDWRKEITVWEIEIGQRLAAILRPEYRKEKKVLKEAAKATKKERSVTTLSDEDKEKALERVRKGTQVKTEK
jgi:hypothetical protein